MNMIIERDIYPQIQKVIDDREAIVITGMRRVGKTTLLKYIANNLKSSNKIFLDLENPANQRFLQEANYEKILDNFRFLGIDTRKKGYVFLDEIQFIKNIPSVVKYISDHHKIKFFLSGSASFYLKNLFSESLAGRKYIFELFPLSFGEFLKIKNIDLPVPKNSRAITRAMFLEISRHYDEYLLYGGFPGVALKETSRQKKAALEDIFTSYFQLEVRQLGDFKKIDSIRDLIFLLMQRTGARLDISKLSGEIAVARETVYNYLSFLESTYFIKLIRPFSRNRDTELRSQPKFYICDTGILNQFARVSDGAIFENAVFSALRRKGGINYYQRKSGREIDFILGRRSAFEVKLSPGKRDFPRLATLAKELKLDNYHIVSRKFMRGRENVVYGFEL